MAYIKNTWVDQKVERPRTYEMINNSDGSVTLVDSLGLVEELGTPVNADNMNHIEDGIAAGSFTKFDIMAMYQIDDLVTNIDTDGPKIYKSLMDNNSGNTLDNSTYWEEIKLGGGSAFNMFDTKLLDHVLTHKESKGWALQGTYVYKEAVAGSRYGYPDFYAKCVEEKDLGTPTETVLGENTITLYTNANGHTFYDIADKEAIDAWYSTYGIAWYYGIDKENERIFLPRTKWFIQPTGEITEVNTVNEAGLPNITGSTKLRFNSGSTIWVSSPSGAISASSNAGCENQGYGGTTNRPSVLNFNASNSNSIYGNSDTVQPPSINQLLYICVGNTNVESAVTDVVDVTTTENDTVPLGYSTYQNGIIPNTSWLKSQGQWNDGNLYSTFYNEFVQKIGQSFASGYVKEITEEYDDYDLVINQDDMTFRLPLLDGSESVVDNSNVTTICNGVTSYEYTISKNGVIKHLQYWGMSTTGSERVDLTINGVTYSIGSNYGEDTFYNIPVKKGDTVSFTSNHTTLTVKQYFTPYTGNGSLYFKVANAVQNLELLDAGEVLEVLSTKTDKLQACEASFPSNKYIDLTLGASGTTYTAPANGWYSVALATTSSSGGWCYLINVTAQLTQHCSWHANAGTMYNFMPVGKGDILQLKYGNATAKKLIFSYAQGEVE